MEYLSNLVFHKNVENEKFYFFPDTMHFHVVYFLSVLKVLWCIWVMISRKHQLPRDARDKCHTNYVKPCLLMWLLSLPSLTLIMQIWVDPFLLEAEFKSSGLYENRVWRKMRNRIYFHFNNSIVLSNVERRQHKLGSTSFKLTETRIFIQPTF